MLGKIIFCFRMHHTRADIDHLYVKRKNNDGRSLIPRELTYKTTPIRLRKYLDTITD